MDRRSLTWRLLEGACRLLVALGAVYAVVLLLTADPDALLITYERGGLTPLILLFAGACAGWLCLRTIRSRQRLPVMVVIGVACAIGMLAVLWRTANAPAEEHVTPSPSSVPNTGQPPGPPSVEP